MACCVPTDCMKEFIFILVSFVSVFPLNLSIQYICDKLKILGDLMLCMLY